MASRDAAPTVIHSDDFDPEADSVALYEAMKGAGTDEEAVIDIVCKRSYGQLKAINKVYQQMHGKSLQEDLKDDLSGHFEKLVTSLFMTPAEHDATTIREAVEGVGTDETAVLEILCTRNNDEIKHIKQAYKLKYATKLMDDLKGDFSGDIQHIMVALATGARAEDGPDLDGDAAAAIAELLFNKGEGQIGTSETTFIRIFARRGFHQLAAIAEAYLNIDGAHEEGLMGAIKDEFSGYTEKALTTILTVALAGREVYFAKQLHKAMEGIGTDDDQVCRLMVSRARQDLATVAQRFEHLYETSLEEYIDDDISGDFKAALLALLRGNWGWN